MKVILLPNNGADEASLLEITLFLTPYFHIRIFRVYQVWQFANFEAFHKNILNAKYKMKIWFSIFWCGPRFKISYICKNKSTRNIQIPAFAKITTAKNVAA